MKVVALVSGGKDSCYAMMRCIDFGHEIVALANLLPADDSVDELDSYMYQTVGHQIVTCYAKCMGLPLFRRRIRGCTRHQELSYKVTPGDEVEDLFILLNYVKQQIPSVTAVSSGAIASDYQRLRVESVCSRLGLVSLAYLWKQDQMLLLEEMIRKGIIAIIIKVAAMGLVPAKHLGKELVDLHPHLLQLEELYGVNVCGEGGEFETLTLDFPLFVNARIFLDKFEVVLHSSDSIAPVGILHPLAFHLEQKRDAPSFPSDKPSNCTTSDEMGYVREVKEEFMEMLPSTDTRCIHHASKRTNLCISTTKRGMFTIGCSSEDSSSEGLQEVLSSVLSSIELQLIDDGFDWGHVLYVHLYISDMGQFAVVNNIYTSFITERKCPFGVPSRSTIEVPLLQVDLGDAYVEVLVSSSKTKKVLHVQSISCWAPSCIGPYSQATLHGEILYMAGQLGLDPPTMMLVPGGPVAELDKTLENCEAVANCFNSSIASSAILFVIYCSMSLSLSERAAIEQRMEIFLKKMASQLENGVSSRSIEPIFLYVLASSLPKGALLEVKPIVHVFDYTGTGDGGEAVAASFRKDKPNYWGFEYSEWHDSCYQQCSISGKICITVISITRAVAQKIYSLHGQSSGSFQDSSYELCMYLVAKFCVYLLDKILLDLNFYWEDLVNLRIYYAAGALNAAELSLAFTKAFSEFAKSSNRITITKQQHFNLIPVIGSGRSALMEDLITCELFAISA